MSVVVGALLDVSRSMNESIGDGVNEEGGTWVHSIFRVVDDLVQYDVSESNRIFVVGVGAKCQPETFDIITTIMRAYEPASDITIANIFRILELNGAITVRAWVDTHTLKSVVSELKAEILLEKLRTDRQFAQKFVNDYLPLACRSCGDSFALGFSQYLLTAIASEKRKATKEEIEQIMEKAVPKHYSDQDIASAKLARVNVQSVKDVKEVSKILHGRIEEQHLTSARVRELHQLVEPFIYGGTPMFTALNEAEALFRYIDERNEICKKMLFILSDGEPTDDGFFGVFGFLKSWKLAEIKPKLEKENVVIVSCFISKSSNVEPRKLHSVPEDKWEEGAKFMFNLSSVIPTSSITRAVFMKNKWQIDITNNETKLFMHVNHPDNLRDACNLARNAVCFQDSLSELLVSVSLDIYINDKNHSVKVYDQDGENTCYAHASATVVHLAMHRILGRDNGHPSFEALRDEMTNKYGKDGTNTLNALEEICPQYRLQCKEVDVHGAMEAITEKRPVVAIFGLLVNEWQTFYDFFERTRNGILTERDLHKRRRSVNDIGHAVVLTSFNSKCLHFMNSWGDGWADNGFFKVKNAGVLKMEFIDIFWNESDLTASEKASYRKRGSEVADILTTSLKALQVASFICPECKRESNVDKFTGTLTRVNCPKCRREFSSSDGKGNLLALNIYLTTLSG